MSVVQALIINWLKFVLVTLIKFVLSADKRPRRLSQAWWTFFCGVIRLFGGDERENYSLLRLRPRSPIFWRV
ncbi:hypothetical protein, partial [Serratia marcescens]|uniref:hypothetical protein n=1 Tax=Serratia marcescens TaxID=615 RepID=UPI003F7D7E9B